MRRTRWTSVVACFVIACVLTALALDLMLRHRGWIPVLSAWGAVTSLAASAALLVAGLAVRRLRAHEQTWMTPTGAAATAAAAQASAWVGALVAGVYGGELVVALLAPDSPFMTSMARVSALCLLACLLWSGVGMLVEHWCALDLDDDDDPDAGSGGRGGVGGRGQRGRGGSPVPGGEAA